MNKKFLIFGICIFVIIIFIVLFPLIFASDTTNSENETSLNYQVTQENLGDGKFAQTSSLGFVNYYNGSEFLLIDLTILSSSYLDYEYELTTAPYHAYFQDNIKAGKGFRFEVNDSWFTYDLSGGKMQWAVENKSGEEDWGKTKSIGAILSSSPDVYNNIIQYNNSFLNTHVQYRLQNELVKENFILSSLPVGSEDFLYLEYMGDIEFDGNLTIWANGEIQTNKEFTTSGKVEFKDKNNQTIYYLLVPIATDSNDISTLLLYDIKPNGEKLTFGLKIPISWLSNESRVYPIYIDPSSGPNAPGEGVNDDSIGSIAWDYPMWIEEEDGYSAGAHVFTAGGDSHAEDYSVRLVKNGVIVGDNLANNNNLPTTSTDVYYGSDSSLWGETWSVIDINGPAFGVVFSVVGKTIEGEVTVSLYSYYLNAADFGFMIPSGSTIDGIQVKVRCHQELGDGDAKVDSIRMTVYYTLPEGDLENDASFGTVYWANPTNARLSDNVYATATSSSGASPSTVYLKATNFGFDIPSDATILGIKVKVEKSSANQESTRHVIDSRVRLVDELGNIGITDKASGTWWASSDTTISYGGATDLWGDSWTPANINDADFGAVISALLINSGGEVIAKIDYITIIIYYERCTCPGLNQNWEIDMSYHCDISTNCDLGTGTLSFIGSGYTTCDARIDTTNMGDPGVNGILYINDECVITVD